MKETIKIEIDITREKIDGPISDKVFIELMKVLKSYDFTPIVKMTGALDATPNPHA